MIPAAFVTLDEFPLTPNGKIDRKALPAPHSRPDLTESLVEPANETERRLREIWQDVLNIRPVGVEDEFLELGGDSLLCVQLLLRIEREFGRAFFASMLVPEITIRRLASLLDGKDRNQEAQSSLVLLRSGSKPPLFFLPGLGGLPMDMFEISPHFQTDRTLYTLRAPGLEDDRAPMERVEDLASYYLRDIRTVQPKGPYLLGGWSFGALVAFEMARQLQLAGEEVEYLALVDEFAPHAYDGERLGIVGAAAIAYNLLGWVGSGCLNVLRSGRRWATSYLQPIANGSKPHDGMSTENRTAAAARYSTTNLPMALRNVIEVHQIAEKAYRPGIYTGQVFVYRTDDRARFKRDKVDRGWQKYVAGEVIVRRVPGIHFTVHKNPYAAILAECMETDMNSVGTPES
jgi:thioesterase domain-containing protein/acyl carrier protein